MSAKSGAQYKVWQGSKHAKAYEALASEQAKAIAKQKGIADPQKSEACLKCHAPASTVAAEAKKATYTIEEGVSCEACHGPGSAYMKMGTMKAIASGKEPGDKYGLVKPTEKTCKKCHNAESPTYDESKPFKFEEMFKKIAHPKPGK
jgi:nitrate/TMAO reductase-like tetraheme cytochrome c subunit